MTLTTELVRAIWDMQGKHTAEEVVTIVNFHLKQAETHTVTEGTVKELTPQIITIVDLYMAQTWRKGNITVRGVAERVARDSKRSPNKYTIKDVIAAIHALDGHKLTLTGNRVQRLAL